MPTAIEEAERLCREAGAAFARAIHAGAPEAEITALHAALMRAADEVCALRGEARPGDRTPLPPPPPPPPPAPPARITPRPVVPGPPPRDREPDLFG